MFTLAGLGLFRLLQAQPQCKGCLWEAQRSGSELLLPEALSPPQSFQAQPRNQVHCLGKIIVRTDNNPLADWLPCWSMWSNRSGKDLAVVSQDVHTSCWEGWGTNEVVLPGSSKLPQPRLSVYGPEHFVCCCRHACRIQKGLWLVMEIFL